MPAGTHSSVTSAAGSDSGESARSPVHSTIIVEAPSDVSRNFEGDSTRSSSPPERGPLHPPHITLEAHFSRTASSTSREAPAAAVGPRSPTPTSSSSSQPSHGSLLTRAHDCESTRIMPPSSRSASPTRAAAVPRVSEDVRAHLQHQRTSKRIIADGGGARANHQSQPTRQEAAQRAVNRQKYAPMQQTRYNLRRR